jgi:hypothetical protein
MLALDFVKEFGRLYIFAGMQFVEAFVVELFDGTLDIFVLIVRAARGQSEEEGTCYGVP